MSVSRTSGDKAAFLKTRESSGGYSRKLFTQMLSRLEHGSLVVREGDREWVFGNGGQPTATIDIHCPSVYRKILFGGSIGAGETYIDRLWDVDDLTGLVRIMVRNMELLDSMERGLAWLLRPIDLIRHALKANNRARAKQNILAHYDLGNELYQAFLDRTMMYSSALYPEQDSSLEDAQQHKLDTICRKLDLKPTDSVIEIGSGWGGFAIHAAREYGCHVTTTTISDAQFVEAKSRIEAAGLQDRITLLRSDYRDLAGKYDKLVSIEMIEAVGHEYMPHFFSKCQELLKPEGVMLLQAITIADQKYSQYVRGVDFIQRYIFPGGCIPSVGRMVQLLADRTDMVVRQLDDFGYDYARTIKDWLGRFHDSFPNLKEKGYGEEFRRLWEFYLCYCRGGFLERSISVVHLVASRPDCRQVWVR